MSSPFSKQMSQNIARLSDSLNSNATTLSQQLPKISTPPVSTTPVGNVPQSPSNSSSGGWKKYLSMETLKHPWVKISAIIIVLFGILIAVRPYIWKNKEKRPGLTKIFLGLLIVSIPVFFWYLKRNKTQ